MSEKNFQRLSDIVGELNSFDDSEMRAEYLLETAERFKQSLPSEIAHPYPESSRVPACESGVYVFPTYTNDERMEFSFLIENPHGISAKALAVILVESLSGAKLEEIKKLKPEMVKDIFGAQLSLAKDQGLRNLIIKLVQLAKNQTATTS